MSKALPALEKELSARSQSRKSLHGLWRGLSIGEAEIEEVRCQMWKGIDN